MYNEQALRKDLKTHLFGSKIYTFDIIDSTNNCARALAGCWANEGTVIIAEQQTAGKGRLGRAWQANPNENLTFSVILRPSLPPDALNAFPLYVAVAVAEAVEKATGLHVDCKWPNDLLVNRKKFAGILLEGSVKQNAIEYVVMGIGVNVNQRLFTGDLQRTATSLRLEARKEVDRTALFHAILASLEAHYGDLNARGFDAILSRWLSHSTMINKQISVSENGQIFSGVVTGLSPDGGLLLQSNGSVKTLFAGDVTILGM
jgi:BirA family biotin operon repressor/biotin-[acetyl-CoA-carboxylase] ligase